jgi:pentatricopeptide repeat protein
MNRKLMTFAVCACALLLLCLVPARAQNVKEPATGIEFPAQVNLNGKNFAITGTGVRKKLGFKVYAIASYVEAGKLDKSRDLYAQMLSDGPAKRIVMHFVRDVEVDKIRETFWEGLEKNIPHYDSSPAKQDAEAFLDAMMDMNTNDEMHLYWWPGGTVEVNIKGQPRGKFPNPILARAIWSIWLGNSPISGELKTNLVASVQ